MNNKWERPFGTKGKIPNIAGWTDCIIEKTSSIDSSLLSENMTPKFETICEKNNQEAIILQLRSQIMSLNQNYIKLTENNSKLKQELDEKKTELEILEEKCNKINEILLKNEEEK